MTRDPLRRTRWTGPAIFWLIVMVLGLLALAWIGQSK